MIKTYLNRNVFELRLQLIALVFKLFISYSQDDFLGKARKLQNYLSKVISNSHVYIDQIKPKGEKWREFNDNNLKQSDLMILIITPAVLHSEEVKREIELAKDTRVKILPCKHDDLQLEWDELPLNLGHIDGIEFEDEEVLKTRLYREVNKISKTIKSKPRFEILKRKSTGYKDILVDGNHFEIQYKIEGLISLDSLEVDRDTNAISFRVDCVSSSKVLLKIPRRLIDSKTTERDAEFFILIDGEQVTHEEIKTTEKERWLQFTCNTNSKIIEIIGTEMLGISAGRRGNNEHEVILVKGSAIKDNRRNAEPEYLKIAIGDTVTWKNCDSAAHTVTSGTIKNGTDRQFDSGLLMSKNSISFTFEKSGIYTYFCMVHPWKECTIVVE